MATITNLSMFVGEDKPFLDTIFQADGVTPQDITGWLLTWVLHAYGSPNIVYLTKTIGSGLTVPVPGNGQVTISVTNADTTSMRPDLYDWYIQRNDSGNQAQVSAGLFSLNRT